MCPFQQGLARGMKHEALPPVFDRLGHNREDLFLGISVTSVVLSCISVQGSEVEGAADPETHASDDNTLWARIDFTVSAYRDLS